MLGLYFCFMSNKFDGYDDNDEITLSSTSNNKKELLQENGILKSQLAEAKIKIEEYEQVISNGNVKEIKDSNLSDEDLFNIMHNSTFIIAE